MLSSYDILSYLNVVGASIVVGRLLLLLYNISAIEYGDRASAF